VNQRELYELSYQTIRNVNIVFYLPCLSRTDGHNLVYNCIFLRRGYEQGTSKSGAAMEKLWEPGTTADRLRDGDPFQDFSIAGFFSAG
jgi:hypothetical protein